MDATTKKSALGIILDSNRAEELRNGILTFENPILYRDYRIMRNDMSYPYGEKYAFIHEDYDGALDAHDHRLGYGKTIEDCILAINEQIEDQIEEAVIRGTKFIRIDNGEEVELSDFITDNTDVGYGHCQLAAHELERLNSLEIGEQCRVIGFVGHFVIVRRTR